MGQRTQEAVEVSGSELERGIRVRDTRPGTEKIRDGVWRVLCRDFFQKYVCADDVVLDLGAGECCFLNNIRCKKKHAVEVSPELRKFAHDDVIWHCCQAEQMPELGSGSIDVVFASNFFEHLPDKDVMNRTLLEIRRVLKDGGKLMVLQPNVRFSPTAYWDIYAHRIALTDRSLIEALELAGFRPLVVIPRFLPYTMRSSMPKHPLLVTLYLRLPLAWHLLGRQSFILAEKRG